MVLAGEAVDFPLYALRFEVELEHAVQRHLRVGVRPVAARAPGGAGGGGGIDYYWGGGGGSSSKTNKAAGTGAERTKLAANAKGSGSGTGKSRRT